MHPQTHQEETPGEFFFVVWICMKQGLLFIGKQN